MSPSHFSRQCRLFYNISPMRMVARIRLQSARDLLKNTDFKLNTIAEKIGYDNAFSLSVAFKKNIGVSPQNFRNNIH
jgi:transcriptional regulator GlxA family with amidase domain